MFWEDPEFQRALGILVILAFVLIIHKFLWRD
jgi:hypothetical protein